MLSTLSKETLRTRFFSVIKDISHEWLILFCNIDYDRHMAIVAEMEENGKKSMIGVARLIMNQDLTSGELAILVQDKFQGKHLGTKFVEVLIEIARERGLRMSGQMSLPKMKACSRSSGGWDFQRSGPCARLKPC